jgi:virulence-associated protein VagC
VSEKVELPSKKVKKLSKKGRKEVIKPTEGRISTRQMVERKKMEKKGFLKKLKKKKKEIPKQKIKEKTPPEKKVEEKKKTDLDSLLEEEGLKDK